MTEPLTPTAARDLVKHLAEMHNLPKPVAVETTATGQVTVRVADEVALLDWARWLGVGTFPGVDTVYTIQHSAQPAVAGLGLTVYAQIGA